MPDIKKHGSSNMIQIAVFSSEADRQRFVADLDSSTSYSYVFHLFASTDATRSDLLGDRKRMPATFGVVAMGGD